MTKMIKVTNELELLDILKDHWNLACAEGCGWNGKEQAEIENRALEKLKKEGHINIYFS